jgi:CO/xanthine dehydrogenase FAD-binding subunit
MITEYHRPSTVANAIELLSRQDPLTIPLAGGSHVNLRKGIDFAVVDLQDLPLRGISREGNTLSIGATTTLDSIENFLPLLHELKKIIRRSANKNVRQIATIGGTIAGEDGRSIVLGALLALDATVTILPDDEEILLGELLPFRESLLKGKIISKVRFNLSTSIQLESVSKTPASVPFIYITIARWKSNRSRVVMGGFGLSPTLVADGAHGQGVELAAQSALPDQVTIQVDRAYLAECVKILTLRCLQNGEGRGQ